MISKERLKELIGCCKTIYTPDKVWETIGNIKLNKSFTINNNRLQASIRYENMPTAIGYMSVPLEELYENKEDAEFIVKFHTQRPEYFEPPTWEEFEREHKPYRFISKGGLRETIYIFDKNVNNKLLSAGSKFFGKPTKDNYIKACEYAKSLFLGGNDGDIR